jgi:hypothetical protein
MKFRRFLAFAALVTGLVGQTPSNNNCSGAVAVADGINPAAPFGASGSFYTNVNATTSTSFPTETACGDGNAITLDVFFSYTAGATGPVTVETCTPPGFTAGTLQDSMIAVYNSSACPSGAASLACGDENCNSGLSSATFAATAGAAYLIRVGSWAGAGTGTFYLTIKPPAPNDECSSAVPIQFGVNPFAPTGASNQFFTNVGATTSTAFPSESVCGGGFPLTHDVFFTFTATVNGATTVENCTPPGFASGTLVDSMIAVYSASDCGAALTGLPTSIACNDQHCVGLSKATFTAVAGQDYLVRVGSWDSDPQGTFYLTVSHPTPSNDEPAGAIALSDGINPPQFAGSAGAVFTSAGATASQGLPFAPIDHDVFFTYTPVETGTVEISLCTPAGFPDEPVFDALLRVYDGSTELAFNDDVCFLSPAVTVVLTAGVAYTVQVGGINSVQFGTFYVTVQPKFALTIDSPSGPGSLRIRNHHGVPSSLYYTAITLTPGGYPNGWFFGVAPSLIEIYTQLAAGPPFVGVLNASGVSNFTLPPGLPALTLYGVTLTFGPGNILLGATAPASHTL